MDLDFHQQLLTDIKCILAPSILGLTITGIRKSFAELLGNGLEHLSDDFLDRLLQSCPDIRCFNKNGEYYFNYCSTATTHIMKMNAVSKPPRRGRSRRSKPKPPSQSQPKRVERDVFFENNRIYLNRKYRLNGQQQQQQPKYGSSGNVSLESDNYSYLDDYELIGDDFLLSLKKFELGQQFERGRIHSVGFCVSGQTVRAAYEKVRKTRSMCKKVIVNIGSVDLLHHHSFVRISHDIELLHQELLAKGVETVIWTTLAPLANQLHEPLSRQKLMDINKFLRYRFANVIDLHQVMVNTSDDKILFACYQPSPRRVSGSTQAHVFWNKIGRQRVLQKIQTGLEALPLYFSSSFNENSVLI